MNKKPDNMIPEWVMREINELMQNAIDRAEKFKETRNKLKESMRKMNDQVSPCGSCDEQDTYTWPEKPVLQAPTEKVKK